LFTLSRELIQDILTVGNIFSFGLSIGDPGSSTGGSGSTIGGVVYFNLIDACHCSQSSSVTTNSKVESLSIVNFTMFFSI